MNLLAAASESSLPLWMVGAYLVVLLGLGIFSSTLFRGTSTVSYTHLTLPTIYSV